MAGSKKYFSDVFGALDWPRVAADLAARGNAVAERVLSVEQCHALTALYVEAEPFRSRVIMSRHGFGRGEYKYFTYPLPGVVAELRTALYPHLAPIANDWNQKLGIDVEYPQTHDAFLKRCHQAGQTLPTPLLLRAPTVVLADAAAGLAGMADLPAVSLVSAARPRQGVRADERATLGST